MPITVQVLYQSPLKPKKLSTKTKKYFGSKTEYYIGIKKINIILHQNSNQ